MAFFQYTFFPYVISADSSIYFESINLNTASNWYTDKPDGKDLSILSLQQLEKDTFFVGLEHKAMFVDRQGKLKPSQLQASELNFDKPSERMGKAKGICCIFCTYQWTSLSKMFIQCGYQYLVHFVFLGPCCLLTISY